MNLKVTPKWACRGSRDPISKFQDPPITGTFLAQKTSNKHKLITINLPVRLVDKPKKTKKKEKRHKNSGQLTIRPDHPHRRIKIKLYMMGVRRCAVIRVKCPPNRLRDYGAVGVENGFPHYFGQWLIQQKSLYQRTSREQQETMPVLLYSTIETQVTLSDCLPMFQDWFWTLFCGVEVLNTSVSLIILEFLTRREVSLAALMVLMS